METHLRFAALLGQRAGIYRPGDSAIARSRCLGRMIRARGYSDHAAGSLGSKAFVKDLLAAGSGLVYRG